MFLKRYHQFEIVDGIKKILILIFTLSLFTSCDFVNNILTYKDTTEGFVESLKEGNYQKSLSFMATDHDIYKNTNIDSLKLELVNFRKSIVDSFGTELNYKFVTANKTFSSVEGKSTAPNTTLVKIEFSNDTEFGVFEISFDDHSNKILHIKTLDLKEKIPNMIWFWLFGVFAICVPIFNIWIIRRIKKSNLKKKWLKYIAIICLNVPAISYNSIHGLSLSIVSFQLLFGISFSYMGYLNSVWTFGIPLGGIYWLWKLNKKVTDEATENELIL